MDTRPAAESIRRGRELTDVSVPGLFIFAGALLASLVVILLGLVVVFKGGQYLNRRLDVRNAATEPGARSLVHAAPDYHWPLLQVKPEEDLRWMQAHVAADLNSYGWVDRPAGVVRLPIERAMDLLVARGLPPISPGLTLEALQRERAQPQVFGQALRP